MPCRWFECVEISDSKWGILLTELVPIVQSLGGDVMQLLEKDMGDNAPVKLLRESAVGDFGNWLDAFISRGKIWGRGGSLKSVAWITRRIAQ